MEAPMIVHEYRGGRERCIHCGTLAENIYQTVCPGPQRRDESAKLRPEPARREYAVDAVDTIHARIVELAAERTEALNISDIPT